MHHGTCVKHVAWYMPGSLTRDGGENVPGIPGACASCDVTYLVRGPLKQQLNDVQTGNNISPFYRNNTAKHRFMLTQTYQGALYSHFCNKKNFVRAISYILHDEICKFEQYSIGISHGIKHGFCTWMSADWPHLFQLFNSFAQFSTTRTEPFSKLIPIRNFFINVICWMIFPGR